MLIYPDKYFNNVKEIKIEFLKENNIKGLILDIDNTLIDFDRNLLEGAKEWCENLKQEGIKFYILSNTNKKDKVEKVSKELDIPYINFAKKPLKKGFKTVQKNLRIENPREIAAVRRSDFYRCCRSEKVKNVCNFDKAYW